MKYINKQTTKIAGEIILILSFLTQTLLFDYYNDKSKDLGNAYSNQSLIDKGAELKELKYFVASFPGDTATSQEYKQLNIKMVAQKIAQSQLMAIISSKKSKQDKIDLSNLLIQKASRVKTFEVYMNFIDFVNKNSLQTDEIISNISEINSSKEFWRILFISFYILGATLLTYSIRFEKD